MEPAAAKSYAEIKGNNMYQCGFVINPHASHLGTSPDRKVFDQSTAMKFGLLEIKCPKVKSVIECKYLKEVSGSYRLKHSHSYYYQMIGQMDITWMPWCDFYVYTESDYHLEKISFDKDFWAVMRHKLDIFFYNYYLPLFVKWKTLYLRCGCNMNKEIKQFLFLCLFITVHHCKNVILLIDYCMK